MKSESVESGGSIDENGSDRRYGPGGGLDSSQRDSSDRNPPPPPAPLEGVPSSPSGSATTPNWTPGMASVKLEQPQKGIPSTTTDGELVGRRLTSLSLDVSNISALCASAVQ